MSKKKVLVVDDDPNIVRALALRLQEDGYDVQAAGDRTDPVNDQQRPQGGCAIERVSKPRPEPFVRPGSKHS